MRLVVLSVSLLVVLAFGAPSALAAPLEQPCGAGAIDQRDVAGVYISSENLMRLTIYPCTGSVLLWSNTYGTHEAGYIAAERMPDGGLIARVYQPDPYVRSLDGRNVIGVKPAEVGWIQIITIGPFADDPHIYRLKKV